MRVISIFRDERIVRLNEKPLNEKPLSETPPALVGPDIIRPNPQLALERPANQTVRGITCA